MLLGVKYTCVGLKIHEIFPSQVSRNGFNPGPMEIFTMCQTVPKMQTIQAIFPFAAQSKVADVMSPIWGSGCCWGLLARKGT